ncbi:MAG: NADP-dependent malic enzyme [Planctomycetota bacterium]
MVDRDEALQYHSQAPAGKLEIRATKPTATARDLALAYSPGVAEPCRVIAEDREAVFEYTAKGNLVGVISNGTAVLGLGNIGPEASKPVMEGKAVLFKRFAGIDVFDIELAAPDVDAFCQAVKAMEPTFGGVNIEDVKAPECFVIEERLKAEMEIPVFHDDQHGTAIIIAAGLVNALRLQDKMIEDARFVFSGAGAAALATARLMESMGAKDMLVCDSKGVLRSSRADIETNPFKKRWAVDTERETLSDALEGADVFIGVSVAGAVTPEMLTSMADRPIVFALANPDPEIDYDLARSTRPDAIVGTGRSDFPNQVNNVLGFPFIFRGALDVRARTVNDAMMHAAVSAIAELAREDVDESVAAAYDGETLRFGPEYVIPKPFDPRVLLRVAPAVAKAASESGVARKPIDSIEDYREQLERHLGKDRQLYRQAVSISRQRPQRIAFADGEHPTILRAAAQLVDEGSVIPQLVGRSVVIEPRLKELGLEIPFDSDRAHLIDVHEPERLERFSDALYELKQRRGMTRFLAEREVRDGVGHAAMMVREGLSDGVLAGMRNGFPNALSTLLSVIGTAEDVHRAAGVHLLLLGQDLVVFGDTTLTIDPEPEDLAETALLSARLLEGIGTRPRIAMVSFSNFGSVRNGHTIKVERAVEIVRERRPNLEIDGPMHADIGWNIEQTRELFPFSRLTKRANIFVFPSLEAGNAAHKVASFAGADAVLGPILLGLDRPANVLTPYASVREVVRTATLTSMLAGRRPRSIRPES